MRVYDPVAPQHGPQCSRQNVDALAGKVVGFIDNAKLNFNYLVDDVAELLIRNYHVASVIKRRKISAAVPAPDRVMQEILDQCDVVITGSGD